MVRKETRRRVAVIRIERPAKRNTIDRVTTGEFDELNNFQDETGVSTHSAPTRSAS